MPNDVAATPSAGPTRVPKRLQWYPRYTRRWDERTRTLSFAQMGALDYVSDRAWECADAPCTLEDDAGAWKRLLGADWRKLLPVVRRFFTPCPEHPGRVRDAELYALWQEQYGTYVVNATKGKEGGTAAGARRGPKPKPRNSPTDSPANTSGITPANTSGIADSRQETGLPPGPDGPGGATPASDDAPLTPGGVASPSATGRTSNGQGPPRRVPDDAPDTLPSELPPGVSLVALYAEEVGAAMPAPADAPLSPVITNPEVLARRAAKRERDKRLLGLADGPPVPHGGHAGRSGGVLTLEHPADADDAEPGGRDA